MHRLTAFPLAFLVALLAFGAGRVESAETAILQGLAFGIGEDRLAIAEEGDGGFFAAGFVFEGGNAVVRVVHVRPYTEFPWGAAGLTGATFHGFFVQGDLAAVADGQGGVYVAAAARDLSFVPRLVVGHFSAAQQYTELYSSTDPSFGNPFEVEAVSDGAGGVIVVGVLDPPVDYVFSLRLHHANPGTPRPSNWGVTQTDDEFWIAGDGAGSVLLVHGDDYEVRAQLLAPDNSLPWGTAGVPINIQTGSHVLDRRCVYEPSAGIFHVVWTEADGECFSRSLGYDGVPGPGQGAIVDADVVGSPPSLGLDVEVVGDGSLLIGYGQAELVVQRIDEEGFPMWADANRWIPGDPAPDGYVANDLTLLADRGQFHWTARLGTDPDERVSAGLWGDLATGGFGGAVNDLQYAGDPGFERPRRIYAGVHSHDTYVTIRTAVTNHVTVASGNPYARWVSPIAGEQDTTLELDISGNYLHPTHLFSLSRPGHPEIPLTDPTYVGTPFTGLVLRASADLTGAPLGAYDVVVRSAVDGSVLDSIPDGFEVGPRFTAATPLASAPGPLVAFPNPADPMTLIRFELPVSGPVSLVVHDVAGRVVRRLTSTEDLPAGVHEIPWRGRDDAGREVASGVYLVRLLTGRGAPQTTRVTLVR